MQFKFLSAIFLILSLILVAIFNTEKVLFTFLFFKFNISLAILIAIIAVIGIFIGLGLSALNELEYRKNLFEKNKEISNLKKEIININAKNFGKETTISLSRQQNTYDDLKTALENKLKQEKDIKTDINIINNKHEKSLESAINVVTSDERKPTESVITATTKLKQTPRIKDKAPKKEKNKPYISKYITRRRVRSEALSNFSLTDDYEKFMDENSKGLQEQYEEFFKSENRDNFRNIEDDAQEKEFEKKSIDINEIIEKPEDESKRQEKIEIKNKDAKIFKNPNKKENILEKKSEIFNEKLEEKSLAEKEVFEKDSPDSKKVSDKLKAIELGMTDMEEYEKYKKTSNKKVEKENLPFSAKTFFKEIFSTEDDESYENDSDKASNQDRKFNSSMVDDEFIKIKSELEEEFKVEDASIKMDRDIYNKEINKSMSYDKTAYTKRILSQELVKKQFNWGTNNELKLQDEKDEKHGGFLKKFFSVK